VAAAVPDDRAHERAGGQRQRGRGRLDGIDLLFRRYGLAGRHRLVALEAVRLQQPQIGRHHVADRELDHVSRDQRGQVEGGGLAVAEGQGGVSQLICSPTKADTKAVLISRISNGSVS
jgi:hypothetical protein